MRTFRVEFGPNSHTVHVGAGILDRLGELALGAGLAPGRAAIVTDQTVAALYAEQARGSIRKAGFEPALIEIPPGEPSKSLKMYQRVIDAMVEAGLERTSPVFALGGGVVGDLTGFAAASFLRGVPLVQVPTSVVAQVDSSLGGKTAINHRHGKNLIGAFYQPRLIVADIATLKTLPEREFREGLAEAIKYGAIMDAEMFAALERSLPAILARDPESLAEVVERSLRCKASVVSRDERESGLRKILNFGHTIGHALEASTGYERCLHGEAVAIGMVLAADLSRRHAGLQDEDARRLGRLIEQAGLPTKLPADCRNARFNKALHLDKKRADQRIEFVLLSEIGRALIHKLSFKEIAAILDAA